MKCLNVLEVDEYFWVIYKINEIKDLIYDLEKKGFVYFFGGDVYYWVWEFFEYGKLLGCCLEEM